MKKRVSRFAIAIPLILGVGLISAPGASAMYGLPTNDGGGAALVDGSSTVQSFFNNPYVEAVSVAIANKATMTPTVGMAVTQTVKASGGLGQTVAGVAAVARSYAPFVAAIAGSLFTFGASG